VVRPRARDASTKQMQPLKLLRRVEKNVSNTVSPIGAVSFKASDRTLTISIEVMQLIFSPDLKNNQSKRLGISLEVFDSRCQYAVA
jgi:hypothetical protein